MPARRLLGLLAGTALAASSLGCGAPDQEQDATDKATAVVREKAERSRQAMSNALADPSAPRQEALLGAVAELVESGERNGFVFGRRSEPGDRIWLDVAFDGTGNAGGLAPAEVTVRLCVRFSGTRSAQPEVTMSDTACDTGLDRKLGQADTTVGLRQ
ncbi:hypothetical protein [Micromonospora sp. bgisy143]|uniref:hypothetical protein n=1 Tax=Micromonospora sp. bgisy143 TaxID=3413790 RepID=UPI003EBAAC9A